MEHIVILTPGTNGGDLRCQFPPCPTSQLRAPRAATPTDNAARNPTLTPPHPTPCTCYLLPPKMVYRLPLP